MHIKTRWRAKLDLASPPRPYYDLQHAGITRWVAAGHNLALVQKAAGPCKHFLA